MTQKARCVCVVVLLNLVCGISGIYLKNGLGINSVLIDFLNTFLTWFWGFRSRSGVNHGWALISFHILIFASAFL